MLLSAQCFGGLDLRRVAQPVVSDLVERTALTAHLGVVDGDMVVYIDKYETLKGARLASSVGLRRQAVSTALGKAILALSAPERVEALVGQGLVAATPNSITDPVQFRAELDRVKRQGWAIDDEECEIGIRCAAAPVFDHTGHPVAAISASSIASRIDDEGLRKLAHEIHLAAQGISRDLGYASSARGVA
ncbi:DNA-binding transcriptional regulator, IclR family [Celeribacter baekdonensis]|uniref:DNA-binding transcriptional regulator, IclR family n=1 Tax=Celeribacter baekdonensis TaxID=875171 RepID=A0A1G7QVB2_9RHOB|nr:IclR family transcriptional regulator [Celeribacter baekdonensis]SDG02471.1 DNA-binding transcriptional regulator, IclR family [Celeribacter baekdonensis]